MSRRPAAARLRTGLHAYRQLGPRRATAAAARRAALIGRGRLRGLVLERRPLQVAPAEVATALGARDPGTALERAGDALPSLRRWREQLSRLGAGEREELIGRAEEVMAHRFDLLGSGPTELGPEIDWQRDFKSGRAWPLSHISRLPISYPDASDIKVPWELSRFQHLPLLAAAHQLTQERRYLDEVGEQIVSWIASNPVEFGPNWAGTMDVAIRAVNWIAALSLCAQDARECSWVSEATASLLLHGRFIRRHLEYGGARGNHYLSDIVGLLIVSAVFAGSPEGRDWARFAVARLGAEFHHQVRSDGCDHEASTSYHRLVAELFIVGADAADLLLPGALDPTVRPGIERMLQFVADYTRPDGLAPQIGDADDGRLLPLGGYGAADQRSHLHLFQQAASRYRPATSSAAYRDGGFYILRAGPMYAAVRCGDVGIYGRGCHAHNDLLAFELCWNRTPLVVDRGSYLYTADPAARNRFRSTAVHATLQVDDAEQNELREDRLFAMLDRARPELLEWRVEHSATILVARHHGFDGLPHATHHRRMLRLNRECSLEVVDEVTSDAPHELTWNLPLAPCDVELAATGFTARFPNVTMRVDTDAGSPVLEHDWYSPRYGVREQAPIVRIHGRSEPGGHRSRVTISVEPDSR